jgi:GNAT superfamily N-acetyltransferase
MHFFKFSIHYAPVLKNIYKISNMTSEIKIRPAFDDDAETLSEMICENARSILLPHYNDQQWPVFIAYYSPKMMREKINTQYVFCAELNRQTVGTIALDGDFIVGFYTRLEYLNRGIGKKMMTYLEEFAKVKGLDKIQLAASPAGLSFYHKHGWEKVRDIVINHYGVGFEETLMEKKLKK